MGFKVEHEMSLEQGMSLYQIQDTVVQDWMGRGFELPRQPQQMGTTGPEPYRGHIPGDLTELTDIQLGQLMTQLSLWMEYVGSQLAMADMARSIAQSQLDFVAAKLRLSNKYDENNKKRTAQERDDMIECDQRYVEAKRNYLYLEAFYVLTENVYKAAKQNYGAVSRRVTQRGQEIDQGNRNAGVSNVRVPGAPLIPGRGR